MIANKENAVNRDSDVLFFDIFQKKKSVISGSYVPFAIVLFNII